MIPLLGRAFALLLVT
ncbi:Protein of unknown function [Bacillus toyonensis]|nr:Protein of unknown function [Bacillus toyonensis]